MLGKDVRIIDEFVGIGRTLSSDDHKTMLTDNRVNLQVKSIVFLFLFEVGNVLCIYHSHLLPAKVHKYRSSPEDPRRTAI